MRDLVAAGKMQFLQGTRVALQKVDESSTGSRCKPRTRTKRPMQ